MDQWAFQGETDQQKVRYWAGTAFTGVDPSDVYLWGICQGQCALQPSNEWWTEDSNQSKNNGNSQTEMRSSNRHFCTILIHASLPSKSRIPFGAYFGKKTSLLWKTTKISEHWATIYTDWNFIKQNP